jgi:lysophospholipase L1-like esterase
MIMPDFVLPSRVNQCWSYSGIDSFEHCLDKTHFKQYPYPITYKYNSRGFRDQEWPHSVDELKNAIWCVGDSFTVGVGSALEHTWPWLLQKQTSRRVINVSMDGASNNWISRKVKDILQQIQPRHIVIHWSYFHRREHSNATLNDEDRRAQYLPNELNSTQTLNNFEFCIDQIQQYKNQCQIIHSMIPNSYPGPLDYELQQYWSGLAGSDWPQCPPNCIDNIPDFVVEEIKTIHQSWDFVLDYFYVKHRLSDIMKGINDNLGWIQQLDFARDGHHYDLLTAERFVGDIIQRWNHGAGQ